MNSDRITAEEREDIRELFARYSWAYDTGDPAAYAACFTEDGEMTDAPYFRASGHAELEQAIKGVIAARGDTHWQHINDHLLFSREGSTVIVHSYWALLSLPPLQGEDSERPGFPSAAGSILLLGRYRSVLIRQNGEWLIRERASVRGM